MNIWVTGSSGLVGEALVTFLRAEHTVFTLKRCSTRPNGDQLCWNSETGEILDGFRDGPPVCDVFVHLAGENIAAGRWSPARKERIRASRVEATEKLCTSLARYYTPKIFISASAVGIYGDRGDEVLTEQSAPGRGFLPEVAMAWEAAAAPLENAWTSWPLCGPALFT